MTDKEPANRFKVSIGDLERTAHVRPEDQVESQPDAVDKTPKQLPDYLRDAIEGARLGG